MHRVGYGRILNLLSTIVVVLMGVATVDDVRVSKAANRSGI